METIWKYRLGAVSVETLAVPLGGGILCVQVQDEYPCLWIRVDPTKAKVERKIMIFGAGHDLPANAGEYIGTFQISNGDYIFHVFEEKA